MTDLEASLTSMDWLPKLSMTAAGIGAFSPPNIKNDSSENTCKLSSNNPSSLTSAEKVDYKNDPTAKPSHSYAHLITMAINDSKNSKMSLSEIYQWISDNFAYYRHSHTGWKVSETDYCGKLEA